MGETFKTPPFLGNRHVQTLLGHFWKGILRPLVSQERHVLLPDGDRLVLHDSIPDTWRPGGLIALLVHGLGGCHLSGPVQRLSALLLARGVRAVRIDLRGSGRGVALARRIYNGGCSADVRVALEEIHSWSRPSPLALVGFSLGGNIALKLAGEAAAAPVAGLERVAAVAPPIDLERCAAMLAAPRNRFYEVHFLRCLVRQVRDVERYATGKPSTRFPGRLTLRQFDDMYTAPRGGFANALDYYRRSSAMHVVPEIGVPTLILTSMDDPFIAPEPFQHLRIPANVSVRLVPRGGHLGFLGWEGRMIVRWAEREVADWIQGV
jgi:predicted alpha/beta-fold hydrolase